MTGYSALASTASLGAGIVAGATLTESIGSPVFAVMVGALIVICALSMFLIVVQPRDFIRQDK